MIFYGVKHAKVVIIHVLYRATDYGDILFGDQFRPAGLERSRTQTAGLSR